MDNVMKKMIDDLVKGAALGQGFVRGSRVNVEVQEERGHETKLANHAALGAGLGTLMLPGLGAPIGAALGADEGRGGAAALGSILGGVGGGALGGLGGAGIGALLGQPGLGAALGGGIGGIGGTLYGAQKGGHKDTIMDKLSAAVDEGFKTAAARFGIKTAGLLGGALGMAGSMGGGMLARKLAPNATGLMGHALEMGGQMAGGALTNKLTQPPQGQV